MKPRGQFTISKIKVNGEIRWQVSGTKRDGERVRKRFTSEEEAQGAAQVLQIETANSFTTEKPVMTWLTPEQLQEAEAGFRRLDGKSLTKAIEYFLDTYKEPDTSKKLLEAFNEFYKFKKDTEKRDKRTLGTIKSRVGAFAKSHLSKLVSHVTAQDLQGYCSVGGAMNQRGRRNELRGFFNWCIKRKYRHDNPALEVETVKAGPTVIKALSNAEVKTLLKLADAYTAEQKSRANNGGLIPYIALATFAGLRPQELEGITWSHIDLKNRTIVMDADIAKTGSRRVVEISKNLVAWLKPFKADDRPIFWTRLHEHFDRVKEAAKFRPMAKLGQDIPKDKKEWKPWVPDYMRHTAISNHIAEHRNENETALWAGNSPEVIREHYKALVTPQAAKEFWGIMPPQKKAGKIINLKHAA